MPTWTEILKEFKASETADSVVSMTDSKDLRDGIAAWKSVVLVPRDDLNTLNSSVDCEASSWNWLWEQVRYDEKEFGVVAGLKFQEVGNVLKRLIGLRLIYPDGTVSYLASNFLNALILKQTGRPQKQSPLKKSSDTKS